MVPRLGLIPAATLALLVVSACADPTAVAPTRVVTPAQTPDGRPAPTAVPTPVVEPQPTPPRNAGDVDGSLEGPELTIEFPGEDLLQVTLEDPAAKAWRLVVAGTGDLSQDRWEIVVETGDVGAVITATEIQQGEIVDVMDLPGYGDRTAAAGGCHGTLGVCIDSSAFGMPADGDGRLSFVLGMGAASSPLSILGGSAGWPAEPFVLGPWADTEAFPWEG